MAERSLRLTAEQAVENAREAIQAYIESLEAHGEPIPEETIAPTLTAIEV